MTTETVETMTTQDYLPKAMSLLDDVPCLDDVVETLEAIGKAIVTDALADDIKSVRQAEAAIHETHVLIDNYLAETMSEENRSLADLVLDAERGLRPWTDVVALARRIS